MSLLDVRDLAVARGGIALLGGLSFSLGAGEAIILRGPNGAGKTSLLRTLAGLQPAHGGQITINPDDIVYAAHADGLKSMLTVAENMTFWAHIYGRRDIAEALDAFDMRPLMDRLAGTLSAGQKRRLGLARLLVTGCKVWVLDEPTVSLDAHATAQFGRAVQRHLAQGGAAIIATHIDLGIGGTVLDVTGLKPPRDIPTSDEAFL